MQILMQIDLLPHVHNRLYIELIEINFHLWLGLQLSEGIGLRLKLVQAIKCPPSDTKMPTESNWLTT